MLFLRYNKYHAPFIAIYKVLYIEHLLYFILCVVGTASVESHDFSIGVVNWMFLISLGLYVVSSPLSFIAYCVHK